MFTFGKEIPYKLILLNIDEQNISMLQDPDPDYIYSKLEPSTRQVQSAVTD